MACRDEDAIEIYSVDKDTGMPVDTGKRIPAKAPVCVRWINRKKAISRGGGLLSLCCVLYVSLKEFYFTVGCHFKISGSGREKN